MSPTERPRAVPGAGGSLVFKDLCLDAADAAAAAAFWGPTLGLEVRARDDGVFVLGDDVATHTLWVNPVPEPHAVKNRLHLDVHVAAVDNLVRRGAVVLDGPEQGADLAWTVLADPDGGELCAFVRAPELLTRYRLYELVLDAADPEALAGWWADRRGGTAARDPDEPWWWVEGGAGMPWELVLNRVPEAKTVKNRVHWDVWGRTEEVLAAGATLLRAADDEIGWDVLADPEGNEFCVFSPGPPPGHVAAGDVRGVDGRSMRTPWSATARARPAAAEGRANGHVDGLAALRTTRWSSQGTDRRSR